MIFNERTVFLLDDSAHIVLVHRRTKDLLASLKKQLHWVTLITSVRASFALCVSAKSTIEGTQRRSTRD